MATQRLTISVVLSAKPLEVYKAWLSAREHGLFTGAKATITARVGSRFSAGDGYISGKTLEVEPGRRIVQSWRTTEFSETDPDSRLEILVAPAKGGTRLTLKHAALPPGTAAKYRDGWREFYFEPMRAYFAALAGRRCSCGRK